MSQDQNRLQHRQQEQTESRELHQAEETVLVFETPEELLRHDAAATAPSPALAERVKDSINKEPAQPPNPQSWWRRFLS